MHLDSFFLWTLQVSASAAALLALLPFQKLESSCQLCGYFLLHGFVYSQNRFYNNCTGSPPNAVPCRVAKGQATSRTTKAANCEASVGIRMPRAPGM